MFKQLFLTLGILVSISAGASTHGGGVLSVASMTVGELQSLGGSGGGGGVLTSTNGGGPLTSKEIIFHIGQKDGLVEFAYGKLVDKQWQVQKIELPTVDIQGDLQVLKALEISEVSKAWTELK